MKINTHTIKTTLVSIFLGACVALPAIADDIEIYTSLGPASLASNPNIMFLVDSSGSMGSKSLVKDVYDSTKTYAGSCLTGSIYFVAAGTLADVDCSTSTDYFDTAANTCDHSVTGYNADGTKITPGQAGSLLLVGTYSDQLAQYDTVSKAWRPLSTKSAADRAYEVECISDSGIHGQGTGSKKYIKDTVGWTNAAPADLANPHPVWYNSANNVQLFSGNYMNYLADPGTNKGGLVPVSLVSYIDQVKHAVEVMVRGNTRVDIGLMRFDSAKSEGGAVLYPILDVGADRNDFFTRLANKVSDGGYTPLAEAYYEALLYYGGKAVDYGKFASPSNQTGSTESGNPKFYQTPITSTCDLNYIVVLSDGSPKKDYLNASRQAVLPGFTAKHSCNTAPDDGDPNNDIIDNCLPHLVSWAYTDDVATRADIAAHDGFQNIITHTIGFGNIPKDAQQLLQDTADASKAGGYYLAQDEAELIAAFDDIISSVLATNSTFSSPAVSVNAFNRATNLDDLYFTLFKPTQFEHWEGNLKKFKLGFDTVTGDPEIQDKNGNAAIGSNGFFLGSSHSFWTAGVVPDGPETAAGGAASNIKTPPARKVYTMTGTYSDLNGVLTPSDPDITISNNALLSSNAFVTDVMLGVAGYPDLFTATTAVPYRTALLDWAAGEDVWANGTKGPAGTGPRSEMGDPLHAEPGLVQYGLTVGGDPDLVAYVATNDGYLHAVNTLTGSEYFAFVPQEMLSKLDDIFIDSGANGKQYGLDGNVASWVNDANGDNTISGAGEHAYLYFGMRRGGDLIYSMDVTDRNNPKLRWVIDGGTGDYAEMGQTWSTVNVEKIKMGGTARTVLIFGGGYDTGQDSKSTRGVDIIGRGIFIADADTGELLWRAGPDAAADLQLLEMLYSIPARIKPIDVDGDGFVDRLYTGDMGGQIWRIDIDNIANTATTVAAKGGRIADLAVDGDVNETRRFYYPPDVALIIQDGQPPFLSIVTASGYRAHPLIEDVHDRFYMMRDFDVYNTPSSYLTVTESDLFDATDNVISEGSATQIASALTSLSTSKGWYISLNQPDGSWIGEKSLAEPLIISGTAIITTYIPAAAGLSSASCTPNDGTGSLFFVNVADGTPTYDLTGDDKKLREDRRIYLDRGGIPPTPSVIITEGGTPTLCVGTECDKAGAIGTIEKMYWYEVEQ